jgi:hypothetical protein
MTSSDDSPLFDVNLVTDPGNYLLTVRPGGAFRL